MRQLSGVRSLAACCFLLLLLNGTAQAARGLRQHGNNDASVGVSAWQFIKETADLSTLMSLVQAAGLVETLDDPGLNCTLLLPENEAFNYLNQEQGISAEMLMNRTVELREVLLYHIYLGGALEMDDFNLTETGQALEMANNFTLTFFNYWFKYRVENMTLAFKDMMGRTTVVERNNSTFGLASVFIIDRVLLPIQPFTLSEALSYQATLTSMVTLLDAMASITNVTSNTSYYANRTLDDCLGGTGSDILGSGARALDFACLLHSEVINVTLLTPGNEAFDNLQFNADVTISSIVSQQGFMELMLLSHIIPMPLDYNTLRAYNGRILPTLNPRAFIMVQVEAEGFVQLTAIGNVVGNYVIVLEPDLVAGGSRIAVIDAVLIPVITPPAPPTTPSSPPSPPASENATESSLSSVSPPPPPPPPPPPSSSISEDK